MTDDKKQIARDLLKELMVWQSDMKEIQKRFESIEEKVYNNFCGHLVRGYVDKLDNRFAYLWNILDNILNEE